jgi:hypothetical protein
VIARLDKGPGYKWQAKEDMIIEFGGESQVDISVGKFNVYMFDIQDGRTSVQKSYAKGVGLVMEMTLTKEENKNTIIGLELESYHLVEG